MDTMNQDTIDRYMNIRRFYTSKVFPEDGEHLLIDGRGYTAHLKELNERCGRCCFSTEYGCGVSLEKLDCFDIMNGRRYYFTEDTEDGNKEN